MSATDFQIKAKSLLGKYYSNVKIEWSVTREAEDLFRRDERRYAPRLDIAVGPFNTTQGKDSDINQSLIDPKLKPCFEKLPANANPRCLIAIEVTFSGSSKHILGDILNASVLGLYGIVVCRPELKTKVQRNVVYLRDLAELGKLPYRLFDNVVVMDTDEFENTLR